MIKNPNCSGNVTSRVFGYREMSEPIPLLFQPLSVATISREVAMFARNVSVLLKPDFSRDEPTVSEHEPPSPTRRTRLLMQKIGIVQFRPSQRCTIIYERTRTGWKGSSPEVAGCTARANTLKTCSARMTAELKLHVFRGQMVCKVKLSRTCRHLSRAHGAAMRCKTKSGIAVL